MQTTDAPALPRALEPTAARFPDAPPAFAIRVALALRRALLALADLVVPAHVVVREASLGLVGTQLLGAAARHGVADLVDRGALTAREIAAQTGTDADAMHRTLRALSSRGVFALRADGRFENTRLSRALRAGELHHAREFAMYLASRSNAAAWSDFDATVRTGRGAFDRVHGASVWAWFDAHPDEREVFARAMMGMTVLEAPILAGLYPFAEVRRVCDVGGGRGTLLSELLVRFPHLRGVLCDAPGVLDSARALLAERGVGHRVELVPGSFFEHVPRGCDAYLLKNVLHDWGDARCQDILRVCRGAMEPGARLLVAEALVERNASDGFGPLADAQMMVVCEDGRERSRDDFARLLDATGFRLERVFEAPTTSLLEARAR